MTVSTRPQQDWCRPLGIDYSSFAQGVAPYFSIHEAAALARCSKAFNAFIEDLILQFPSLPFRWAHNASSSWKNRFNDSFCTQLFRSYLYPSIGDSAFFRALTPVLLYRS